MIEDKLLLGNLDNEEVWKTSTLEHEQEMKELDGALLHSQCREELLRMKAEIMDKRQKIFLANWESKLEEKKRDMDGRARILEMREKEKALEL